MSQPILSIQNLNKVYPNGVHALKNISFDVAKGEFLVIIGLSGSGKSTLLRCINQLHKPTDGEIWFQGENVTRFNDKQARSLRTKIAMVFQHFNLIPRFSVLRNVQAGALSRTPVLSSLLGWFAGEETKRAMELLNLVGISDKAQIRADQLSGGQQQRVAIARALNQNPQVLLADEPVASLDPATCHSVMDYLKKVNQQLGITVICNLHFLSLVRQYGTRVIALKGGQIVFDGKPQEITEEWFKRIFGEEAEDVHIQ